jgi:hypothetical protein
MVSTMRLHTVSLEATACTSSTANGGRQGLRAKAREHLWGPQSTLDAIGIEAFAERARRELAATGETVRRHTVETTVELTPQEAQIAGLAARSRWPRRHV